MFLDILELTYWSSLVDLVIIDLITPTSCSKTFENNYFEGFTSLKASKDVCLSDF